MIISTNLTISGMDETSFATDKSILENIIADITNSSASAVEATFIQTLERSNENWVLINVAVKPRDTPHETYAILKMNTSISFREEINLGLQNQSIESNPSVISVSQITRIPGELIGIRLFY